MAPAGIAARALGLTGIGLGLAEIAVPRKVAALIGVENQHAYTWLLRAAGLREVASGAGILARPRPAGWLWGRVAGDVMDLGLLGAGFALRSRKKRVAVATGAAVAIGALDVVCALQLTSASGGQDGDAGQTRQSVTVNRAPEEVYRYWRDFQNLPRFMPHLQSVEVRGDGTTHWRAEGPAGRTVEWDAQLVDDRPGESISWRSLDPEDVPNEGTVRFRPAPGGRGTEVHVEFRYKAPAGGLGTIAARLFNRAPDQQVSADLRVFKQILEAGEVARSDASLGPGPHPARPDPVPAGT